MIKKRFLSATEEGNQTEVVEGRTRKNLKRRKKKSLKKRRRRTVTMVAREEAEEKENLKAKEARKVAKLFLNSRSNLAEKRKEVMTVMKKKPRREILMKSLRTCWLRLRMPWIPMMLVLLRQRGKKRRRSLASPR